MKNTTILFLVGALCILLNQNVFAQESLKKSTEGPVKVMVKQEQTVKKMVRLEPKITSQPVQAKQNLVKSTNQAKGSVDQPDDIKTTQQQILKLKLLLEDVVEQPQKYSTAQIEKLKEALSQKELLLNHLLDPAKK
ncbi:MAG: hypothetical protein R2753_09030 [Chitinophagales bacterium]